MLVVYTPDEIQNNDVLTGFDSRGCVYLYPTQDGESFYLISAWCREGICRTLHTVFSGQFPPGRAAIYGIRGVCPMPMRASHVVKSVRMSDNIFYGLAQFIVELLASAIDNHICSARRLELWKQWWSCAPVSPPPLPEVNCTSKMFLNEYPPEPKIQPRHDEAPAVRLGSWIDIPSSWLGSIPATSLLIYLPRLWAAFNQHPLLNMLTKRGGTPDTILDAFRDAGRNSLAHDIPATSFFLSKAVAKRLMLPFWFTRHAKEDFWAFLFHLIHAAVEKSFLGQNEKAVIPMPILAAEQRRVNGFKTWCAWYVNHFQEKDSPSTISVVRGALKVRGPLAVVSFRPMDV